MSLDDWIEYPNKTPQQQIELISSLPKTLSDRVLSGEAGLAYLEDKTWGDFNNWTVD